MIIDLDAVMVDCPVCVEGTLPELSAMTGHPVRCSLCQGESTLSVSRGLKFENCLVGDENTALWREMNGVIESELEHLARQEQGKRKKAAQGAA